MEIKPTADYNVSVTQGDKIANLTHSPIKLSILIAHTPSRKEQLTNLFKILRPQLNQFTEVLIDDGMDYNIGVKRNKLLSNALGEYIVYIDDDDTISNDYVNKILRACATSPDCIGISGVITTNGRNLRQWHISKEYGKWYEKNSVYYRTPNHISPVRRELALQAGFPEYVHGEDAEYSRRLLPLLKTEVVVKGNLYSYLYVTKK